MCPQSYANRADSLSSANTTRPCRRKPNMAARVLLTIAKTPSFVYAGYDNPNHVCRLNKTSPGKYFRLLAGYVPWSITFRG